VAGREQMQNNDGPHTSITEKRQLERHRKRGKERDVLFKDTDDILNYRASVTGQQDLGMEQWRSDVDGGNKVGLFGDKPVPVPHFHQKFHTGLAWEQRMRWRYVVAINVRRWIGNVRGNCKCLRIVCNGEIWHWKCRKVRGHLQQCFVVSWSVLRVFTPGHLCP
jgi:hypothetical protein